MDRYTDVVMRLLRAGITALIAHLIAAHDRASHRAHLEPAAGRVNPSS